MWVKVVVAEKIINKVEVQPIELTLINNNWNTDILELETFFNCTPLPIEPIKLNNYSMITDTPKFIESHISRLKHCVENSYYLPYLNRLEALKSILQTN